MPLRIDPARLAAKFFILSTVLIAFGYGLIAGRFQLFPYTLLAQGVSEAIALTKEEGLAWYYRETARNERVDMHDREAAYAGVNLVTSIADNDRLSASIVDMDGRTIHQWEVDWFKVWPDPHHLSEKETPTSRPGTNIHGAEILPNGDLLFNYLNKGLVRMNICGDVVWRLPYRTHHSIDLDAQGNIRVPGMIRHDRVDPRFPNHEPPFIEFTMLTVSPDGDILRETSIPTLLQENGLAGLLYMSSTENLSTAVTDDTLHLNDVEAFPADMTPGTFSPGDILLSLRNINTILVFNESTRRIKYLSIGRFVRQHDPDFLDGDTISLFDNNNIAPESDESRSRILLLSAKDNGFEVYVEGDDEHPFYTDIMGKHQWLPNGNLLITEARAGRAFELDENRRVVWQYHNIVRPGRVGWTEEVQRLPGHYRQVIRAALRSGCGNAIHAGRGRASSPLDSMATMSRSP